MDKGENRSYSEGFDVPIWLQIFIEIIVVLAIVVFGVWLAYKISVSDLPNWLKFFLLS